MWGYFGDFVSLLRNIPRYRDLPLAELMPTVFPNLTFVRVVRANKVRQAVSLWKAVQTARWRQEKAQERDAGVGDGGTPPYKAFIEEHRPQLRFHYRAIAHLLDQDPGRGGLLGRILRALEDQAGPGPVRELCRRSRGQHVERAGAPGDLAAPRLQLRAAHEAAVGRAQRRLDSPLQRDQARDGVRPRARHAASRHERAEQKQPATAEHPLHPLPRHGPVRPAVRLSGADAEHPAAGRSRGVVPQRILRRPDLLRQPRLPADGPVLPQQRHARACAPRLVPERLRPARRSPAARRRLLLGADRRAAHLPGCGSDRLRRRDRARHQRCRRRRPDRDRRR